MTVGNPEPEIVQMFDEFVSASTCQGVLHSFHHLSDALDIHPFDEGAFYPKLKGKERSS